MQARIDLTETTLCLIPEIARTCGLDEAEILTLQAECSQYDDTKVIHYLLNLLSFTECIYLTTPDLQARRPELEDEIKLAKINLDALIKTHLLLQTAELSAGLARVESKLDSLANEVAAKKDMPGGKTLKSKWLKKRGKNNSSSSGLFSRKNIKAESNDNHSGYVNLRRTQLIPK